MISLHDAAIEYRNAGIITHPLSKPTDTKQSPGKRPIKKGWQKLTEPQTDESINYNYAINRFNIGAVCGKASNLMVIDVDWHIKGMWESILKDIDTSEWIKQYRTDGRWHWLFAFDEAFKLSHVKPLGIDLLGEAGNVVMSPSKHSEGDIYTIIGDIAKRPELPHEVIERLQQCIGIYNNLQASLNRCRPTFAKFYNAVFVNDKSDIYHDLSIFRGSDGRQRMLYLFAELKANKATDQELALCCMMAFGNAYDADATTYEISQIKPIPAKTESIKADTILSQFNKAGEKATVTVPKVNNTPKATVTVPKVNNHKNAYDGLYSINDNGKVKLNHVAISDRLSKIHNVLSYSGCIYVYENGYYKDGLETITTEIQKIARNIGFDGSIKYTNSEVLHYLTFEKPCKEYPFNKYNNLIPVSNGIVKIDFESKEVELIPHTPEYKFNFKLPANYDKDADHTTIHDNVLTKYVEKHDVDLLYQIPAQAIIQMMGSAPYKKAYLLQGDPNAGKSTYLELLMRVFGIDNISDQSLQNLATNRFSLASLEGKIFNNYDDLSEVPMKESGVFKTLTGKHDHYVEKKGLQSYQAFISAVHVYTCNTPPSFPDSVRNDTAFWERWEYIYFGNVFKIDPEFYNNTFTEENITGYFKRIIDYVIDIKCEGLKLNSTASEVREKWSFNADPLYQYIQTNLEESEHVMYLDKEQFLESYLRWCLSESIDGSKMLTTTTALTRAIDKYQVIATRITPLNMPRGSYYELPYKWHPESKFSVEKVRTKTEQSAF